MVSPAAGPPREQASLGECTQRSLFSVEGGGENPGSPRKSGPRCPRTWYESSFLSRRQKEVMIRGSRESPSIETPKRKLLAVAAVAGGVEK